MSSPESPLSPPCPRCKEGTMTKHPESGWTCQKCGYAPFSDAGGGSAPVEPPSPAMPEGRNDSRSASGSSPPPPAFPRPPTAAPPPRTVFTYLERQHVYDRLMWVEAGRGVRFSRVIPLSVLPPGESIKIEVIVHNSGATPVAVTYYLSLTNPNLQGMRLAGETPTLPQGEVFNVTQTITTALLPGDYSLTMFCLPHPPGTTHPPGREPVFQRTGSPPLKVVEGAVPPGLAGLYSVLKVRTSLVCPTCRGVLLWAYEGMAGRTRAWVCGRCGYRLESGML